jgi:hypothetical protein
VAEDRNVNAIFGDLFTKEGNSFSMRHADLFVDFSASPKGDRKEAFASSTSRAFVEYPSREEVEHSSELKSQTQK